MPFLSKHTFSTFKLITVSLFLSLILGACTTSVSSLIGGRHKHDYAKNFEQMQKYNFNPVPEQLEANPDFRLIRDSGATLAIENTMAAKHIRKERNAVPDFWVNYYFTGEQSISVAQLNKFFAYNLGLAWNDKYGSGQGIANTSHTFSSRTLIIDLVARENNQLIWRGSAPTSITSADTESQIRQSLNKATDVILAPFPPKNNFSSLRHALPD